MNIDEAIEILGREAMRFGLNQDKKEAKACRLGIEALKAVKLEREHLSFHATGLLKGETQWIDGGKDDELDQAASEMLKRAKEEELLPSTMEFRQLPEYEETHEYQIVLWCE